MFTLRDLFVTVSVVRMSDTTNRHYWISLADADCFWHNAHKL